MTLPVAAPTGTDLERFWTMAGKTVAIDFDGVIHPYTDGWTGSVPADEEPMPGVHAFIKLLIAEGFIPVVFSTRADHDEGLFGICDWMNKHGFRPPVVPADEDARARYWSTRSGMHDPEYIKVTHIKPPAVAYVDDRAVSFWYEPERGGETPQTGFIRAMGGVRRLARGKSGASGPGSSSPVAQAPPGS